MEHYGKEKRIYHGIAIPFILMFVVPAIFFAMFYFAIGTSILHYSDIAIFYLSLGFAGLTGCLFDITCVLVGFISGYFIAIPKRIAFLISNVKIFKGKAFKWYFEQFIEQGGPIFWGFVLVFLSMIAFTVVGFVQFFVVYY